MTATEGAPAPWEIWHARFNFDDRGHKFRPVLVLACSQDGLLAAMITSASNKLSLPLAPPRGLACSGADESFPSCGSTELPSCHQPTSALRAGSAGYLRAMRTKSARHSQRSPDKQIPASSHE